MANIFRELKKELGVLKSELRFSREPLKQELIREKIKSFEEVFDFAKEYETYINHRLSSDVGDRLIYYLTEGNLSNKKVADYFEVPPTTIAGNIYYASKAFSTLLGDVVNRLVEAENCETVQASLFEFHQIKKSVTGHYELPKHLLKKVQRRVDNPLRYIKSSPYTVIPRK